MKNRKQVVLGLSGGIDSVSTAYWLLAEGYELKAVYFGGYSQADDPQRSAATFFCTQLEVPLEIVDFSFYKKLPIAKPHTAAIQLAMPNALFFLFSTLCLIATRINAPDVSLGLTSKDVSKFPQIIQSYNDIIKSISASMSEASNEGDQVLQAVFPYADKSKLQILHEAYAWKIPIERTYSCSRGGALHCGLCTCCVERRGMIVRSGLEDRTSYLN